MSDPTTHIKWFTNFCNVSRLHCPRPPEHMFASPHTSNTKKSPPMLYLDDSTYLKLIKKLKPSKHEISILTVIIA